MTPILPLNQGTTVVKYYCYIHGEGMCNLSMNIRTSYLYAAANEHAYMHEHGACQQRVTAIEL